MKCKVITLSISGKGNKIFRNGDAVDENSFPQGAFQEYLKDGAIVPIKKEPTPNPPTERTAEEMKPILIECKTAEEIKEKFTYGELKILCDDFDIELESRKEEERIKKLLEIIIPDPE